MTKRPMRTGFHLFNETQNNTPLFHLMPMGSYRIVTFFVTKFPNYLTSIETINSGKIIKIDKCAAAIKDILQKLENIDI